MATKIKLAALILIAAFGIWLTFKAGIEGTLFSPSSYCAAPRALLCVRW